MTNVRRLSSALALVVLAATACSSSGKSNSSGSKKSGTATSSIPKSALTISSRAFANGGEIPKQYTCDGGGTIPELQFAGAPSGTLHLRVTVKDPDAQVKGGFTHWLVSTIPPTTATMPPVPATAKEVVKWRPPCPPAGSAPHHYQFILTAVSSPDVILGQATLVGTYHR